MSSFLNIKKMVLPFRQLEMIYEHLRDAGKDGVEGIGLLLGKFDTEEEFLVSASLVPKQQAYKMESGLFYYVGGDELHRINMWAYKNKLSLIAQIHSHPGEAYHSETDDIYAIITTVGGFSIVIPNFAADPIDINLWETYRLTPSNEWQHLPHTEVKNLFLII